MTTGTFEKQRAIIYDLVAAGEVQGIVGGLGGIYLNDTAIIDGGTITQFQPIQGTVTVSGANITNATKTGGAGMFSGLSTGGLTNDPRYIQIRGAGKTSTLASAMAVNAVTLVSSANNIFTTSMLRPITEDESNGVVHGYSAPVAFMVRIPGASSTGGMYQGILINVGNHGSGTGNRATLSPPIGRAVSAGTTFEVDEVRKITAITNATTATLASAVTRAATSTTAKLSGAIHQSGLLSSGRSKKNYESAKAAFYRGTRNQPAHISPGGTAAASYTLGPNFDLKWHTSQDNSGGQSTYFITGDSFSMSQNSKEEVDRVKINLEFPGGLSFTGESGKKHRAYAEFQITLEYKSDASDGTFTKELMIGRNYGGTDFITSVPAWNQLMETQRDVLYSGGGSRQSNGVVSKTNQKVAFIKEFDIDLKPFQPLADWRIGIKRLSPDSSKDYTFEKHTVVAATRVKTVEAIIEEKLSYPLSAYGVVEFSAEDFSSIPSRSYHLRGKKVKVPSNYFTREELGSNQAKYTRHKTNGTDTGSYVTWDSSFRGDIGSSHAVNQPKVYTNNPAWIFYDILLDKEIGLGNFLKETDIDKYALYQIARYCDELVPDGKGGLEPRFACNVYLGRQEDAYKVLKDLASTFRSMMYWIDGKIVPVQDTFKEPVYTFTNGNVKDGLFEYTFTGQRARVNQVNVTWTNPQELFKKTVLTIDDTANILDQKRVISKDVVAFGCTSEGQAQRLGKWHMLTSTKETELVSFATAVNASFLRPGDHINVQDHYADNLIASGRILSTLNASSFTLDKLVSLSGFAGGSSHIIYLIYPDSGTYLDQAEQVTINSVVYKRGSLILGDASGNPITSKETAANLVDDSGNAVVAQFSPNTRIEKRFIQATSGSQNTIIVPDQAFSSTPNTDVIWAIGPALEHSTADVKQFRILGIDEETANTSYKISAGLVATDKYEELEVARPVYIPDYSSFSGAATEVPPPTNVTVELVPASSTSIDGSDQGLDAIIGWTPPEQTITDTNQNSRVVPYEYINRYEVTHNLLDGPLEGGFSQVEVGGGAQNIRVPNASAGTFSIRIRTISDTGAKSVYATATRSITAPPPNFTRITNIPLGGTLTTSLDFDYGNGKLLVEEQIYTYITPAGFNFSVDVSSSGNTNFTEQAFNAMANNSAAYVYYDHSTRSADPWKAVQVHTDTVAVDVGGQPVDFNYYKEVGASDNGLAATAGTVTGAIGNTTITGSSSAFLTHFAAGDLIKLTAASGPGTQQTDAEYGEVAEVISNTSLVLKQSLTKTHSGVKAYKQSLKPDFTFDSILGKIEKSNTGVYAAEFYVNARGKRGPGRWQIPVTTLPTNTATAQAAWDSNWSDRPGSAVVGDQATFFEGTIANFTGTATWSYDGSIWVNQAEIIDGDLIVTGSITTDKIFANAITADKIAANQISADQIAANAITANLIAANQISTSELAANSVTTNTIAANQITTSQIAAGAVVAESVQANSVVAQLLAATTIAACHITTQSLSSLSADLGAITGGTLRSTGANAPPDANNPPSGNEAGAFLDLTGGKFTFGNSSKNITFDGTNMSLNGVEIDSTSTVNTTATPSAVIEDNGVQESTTAGIFNFSTGIDVVASGTRATMTLNQPYIRSSLSGIDNGGLGSFTYNQTSGQISYTGPSDAAIRGLMSVATSGDSDLGSLTYNQVSGQYAFAGPTASTIRGKFSGGNGITYTSGTGAIAVNPANTTITVSSSGIAANPTEVVLTTGAQNIGGNKNFTADVTVGGNLTVSGTTTTINTDNLAIEDNIILLNRGQSGSGISASDGSGIQIDRGSAANASFRYLESGVGVTGDFADGWSVGTARLAATGFYGTFYGDASNLSNITADSLSGLSTADLIEDPSPTLGATSHSGGRTAYFSNQRAAGAILAGNGLLRGTVGTNGATYSVKAGSGISVDSSGVNVSGVTVAMLAPSAIIISSESFQNTDTYLMSAAAIEDKILSYGYTTNTGDITRIIANAGNGLTGDADITSGDATFTFSVGAGTGITVNSNDVAIDSTVMRNNSNQTLSGELNVSRNSGVTGSSAPTYSQANIELQTSSNHVPAISFHRGGYSATTLYEYDGQLYANAWTTRAQTGLLLSTGNIGSYALTSSSTIDADTLNGASESVSASNNTIVKRHGSGYIFANYFNTTPNTVSSGVTQICVETGNDGYIRHGTAAAVRTFLNVADGANNFTYTLPAGSSSTRGGFKIGYSENGKNYPVEVSSEKMYVNVPWTDTNTDTNTVTQIREDTGPYRTGNITLKSGTDISIVESVTGEFTINNTSNANVEAAAGNVIYDVITADVINANHIAASSITARELAISNNPTNSTAAGIYFSSSAIEIRDGNAVVRVKIGAL